MNSRKLGMSRAWVARIKPEAAPVEYRDLDTRGLLLPVEASGVKTWVLRYMFAGRTGGRRSAPHLPCR